jgi:hypothetical protein
MRRFLNRRRGHAVQREDVVRRQVISTASASGQPLAEDEQLQSEIRDLMKGQRPGRYRVKVRRRMVRV